MLYGVVFLALAAQLIALGCFLGGWGFLLAWPAASIALVAFGYFGVGPRVFGKRPDGTRNPMAFALLLPYLIFVHAAWWAVCRLSREPVRHEITRHLFIGRRASFRELPSDCELVIDLTCEFADEKAVRRLPGYVCLPTLDAGTPDAEQFRLMVDRVAAAPGVAFVHCAQGHGRSGLFAAAVLIARGLATNAKQAVRMIRAIRPGVRLKANQIRFLETFAVGFVNAPSRGSN